ncbi:uncharacterized protein LOC115573045 isoform X1 [Sparus aurata]|uniref:uncharacterized protein LOC115573045 isoform X1 n=1 Tax=Sparus aurata TaxID=8175 RepID=UPI0011C1A079|nr:uncharacterized protein LOC115573045 isoform X1 [Sparus aurata]
MDLQQKNRPRLEPIQEESEQEDDVKRSKTGEREEEDFQIQAGVETKEVMAEETEEEDEDDKLRVLRPSRRSRSLSSHSLSLPRRRSANNHQDELESFSVSDSHDEATPPKQVRLGHERRSSSGELRMKIFKFRWQKHTTRKPLVRKKENRKRPKKESLVAKPFPEWLVDLMFNIEEATTHQLVVE